MPLVRDRRAASERRSGFGVNIDPAAIPLPGMRGQSKAGVTVNTHTVMTLEVVQTALRILTAGVIKRGDLRAYTTETTDSGVPYRQWTPKQPSFLTNTFAYPGPITNAQSRGRAQTVTSMALFGEAWWFILTRSPRTDAASAVEVLYPPLLTIKQTQSAEPIYEYGIGQNRVQLDPANLVHIPLASMPGDRRGLSSIEYASIAYGLALAAYQFGELWFASGAAPSYLLSVDGDLSEDVAKRVAQRFQVEHSGLSNAHLPIVAGAGLSVQKLGASPDESQFLGTLEYCRTCVAAMFGIPSHLIGGANDKSNVWGANTEEIFQQMETFTYAPYVVPIEEIHSQLLPSGLEAAFLSDLVQPNSYNLAQEVLAIRNTQVATIDEVRSMKLGLPPLPDGAGASHIVPLASNTAPEQTNNPALNDAKPPTTDPGPAGE